MTLLRYFCCILQKLGPQWIGHYKERRREERRKGREERKKGEREGKEKKKLILLRKQLEKYGFRHFMISPQSCTSGKCQNQDLHLTLALEPLLFSMTLPSPNLIMVTVSEERNRQSGDSMSLRLGPQTSELGGLKKEETSLIRQGSGSCVSHHHHHLFDHSHHG